ncbi:hypothetical protein HDU67_006379 [Dinochytrium kinnereticum]|nr:hypothetical protein HDU67_006379 [Dinochytrium kinnereticum]
MSPHRSYNLGDHIRAAAMRMHPPDLKDNFNARMRALFLPSLFQSSEDISNAPQKRRNDSEENLARRTTTAAPASDLADDGDEAIARFEFGNARAAAKRAMRAAGVSTEDNPSAIRFDRGGGMAKPRRTVVGGKRAMLLSPKSHKLKYPLATIDKAIYELTPPDLPRSTLLWRVAMFNAFKQHRIHHDVLEDKADMAGGERIGDVIHVGDKAVDEGIRDRLDVISAMRIRRLLDVPVNTRDDSEMDEMDGILGRFKLFSRLPPSHRYKLYNTCKLAVYPRNKVLIRENTQAKQMYVILLGECLLQIRPNHPTASVNLRLGVGGAAGEFQTYALNETRNMRAVCTMRTECLVIDKLDFVTISREARTVDNYVAEFFATVPSLLSAEKQLPVFLSQRSIVRRYDPETLLIRANEVCPNNYFIVRGKCRALHMVTFVKQDLGPAQDALSTVMGSHARHRYSLTPYTNQKLNDDDELVRELATVMELGPGQMFPPLIGSKVTATQDHDAEDLDTRRKRYSESPAPSPFHFVVVEKLECVVISHQDLVETVPKEILQKLCDSSMGITEVSSQEIEERYLASQGWRGSRDLDVSVMRDLVDPDSFKDESWSNPVVKRRGAEEEGE